MALAAGAGQGSRLCSCSVNSNLVGMAAPCLPFSRRSIVRALSPHACRCPPHVSEVKENLGPTGPLSNAASSKGGKAYDASLLTRLRSLRESLSGSACQLSCSLRSIRKPRHSLTRPPLAHTGVMPPKAAAKGDGPAEPEVAVVRALSPSMD